MNVDDYLYDEESTRYWKYCERCGNVLSRRISNKYFDKFTGEVTFEVKVYCPIVGHTIGEYLVSDEGGVEYITYNLAWGFVES